MIIVADHVPDTAVLPPPPVGWERLRVHPDRCDREKMVALCEYWLKIRYEPYREWAYSRVKPRILVEELLTVEGDLPFDYKLLVFGGKVGLIWIDQHRFADHRRNLYTPGWEPIDVEFTEPYHFPRGAADPRPANLRELIEIAERLSGGIDFVRVDLYNLPDRVVVGELTVYPEGGWAAFDPPGFNRELGGLWSDQHGS
jgi:hypothetical protein